MCPGILWGKFDGHVHIFGAVQGSFEVEAFDIGAQVVQALLVLITLFHMSLVVVRSAILVVSLLGI